MRSDPTESGALENNRVLLEDDHKAVFALGGHICIDRVFGYGLRTNEGLQRVTAQRATR